MTYLERVSLLVVMKDRVAVAKTMGTAEIFTVVTVDVFPVVTVSRVVMILIVVMGYHAAGKPIPYVFPVVVEAVVELIAHRMSNVVVDVVLMEVALKQMMINHVQMVLVDHMRTVLEVFCVVILMSLAKEHADRVRDPLPCVMSRSVVLVLVVLIHHIHVVDVLIHYVNVRITMMVLKPVGV